MLTKSNFKHFITVYIALNLILWLVCFSDGWGKDSTRTISNLLILYDKYEKECYADSTSIDGSIFAMIADSVWISEEDTLMISIIDSIWISKEWNHIEPTFKGFMEFLKGKGRKTD